MHYYQHHIGDFLKDTANLDDHQMATYLRMIWSYYGSEKPFDDDCEGIAFAVRSDEKTVRLILKHYFELAEDGWHHNRCDREIDQYQAKAGKARESANARWKNAKAMRTHNERNAIESKKNANQEPRTNNQQPRTLKEPKGDQQADAEQKSVRRNWVKELVGMGVEERFAKDWMAVRKTKKASMTDTALEAIQREAGIAGITFGEAVKIAAENSWQGFKAAWVNKPEQSGVVQFMTKQERIEAANQQVLLEMNAAEDARIAAMGAQPIKLDDQGFIIEGDFFHAT
jgi:uncharacterized protein YdaU (DUF1376 family)